MTPGSAPHAGNMFFTAMSRAATGLAIPIQDLIVALRHRQALRRLRESEDQTLADIGIDRDDLRAALSEPLWRDPTTALARRVKDPGGHGVGDIFSRVERQKQCLRPIPEDRRHAVPACPAVPPSTDVERYLAVLERKSRSAPLPRGARRAGATKVFARIAVLAALLTAAGGTLTARAAEVRLLSAAAMQSVFKNIAGEFERTSGHKLVISYGTIGAIAQRVAAGEAADVVIGSSLSMPTLVKDGKIDGTSLVTICTTGIGMVVPKSDAVPRLTSADDFIGAVTGAKVVVYADPVRGGAAGIHIGRILQRLGVADKLKAQITLAAGGDVTEVTLAQGSGALGMTQVSEIVGKPGAAFVGPLPAELQNYTVFVAGVPVGAASSPAVRAFIDFLASPTAVAAIKAAGMQIE